MWYNKNRGGIVLFDIKKLKKPNVVPDNILALIKRRRLQLIVHSCIYYRLNNNIIEDFKYDSWARELAKLHKKYGVVKINCYDSYFEDWVEGACKTYTGFKLPITDNKIIAIALRLLEYHNEYKKI